MVVSLGWILIAGLCAAALCDSIKAPRIVGMLLAGILIGPHALNLLDENVLTVSGDLRQIALIIILIKAGLTLNPADLKKVGRPAILMSFLPASFEILAFVLFAPAVLGITRVEAAVMGAVLGAVSPAIVVPRMVRLIETGYGTRKGIPQMILAGASCDDIFVIVLFTTFCSAARGDEISALSFMRIPISIILGIALGIIAGLLLSLVFSRARSMRSTMKTLVLLGTSFLLIAVESYLEGIVPISGLLAVVAMACTIRMKCARDIPEKLSGKFSKIWLAAEVILFVLVGAAVDIRYTLAAGSGAIAMIFIALAIRMIGVVLCMIKTPLARKERLFCMIAYTPKATVQAAIGSVPLALGLRCGQAVLSVAVLAILITAPLGAFGIDASYNRLLERE